MPATVNVRKSNFRKINRVNNSKKPTPKANLSGVTNHHERVALRSNPHANTALSKKKAKRLERMTRLQGNQMQ